MNAPQRIAVDPPPCLSGFGKFDTDLNHALPQITLQDIRNLADNPQSVPKDKAQWLITMNCTVRRLRELKPEERHWYLWADIDENKIGFAPVVPAVNQIVDGCDVEIFTSRSATLENARCRVFIPLAEPLDGVQWVDCQTTLNGLLESIGGLELDRSNEGRVQPMYLPNRGQYYDSASTRNGLRFHPLLHWEAELKQLRDERVRLETEVKQRREEAARRRADHEAMRALASCQKSLIDTFNERYTVEEILLQAGYDQQGDTFRHSNSETGSFSASVKDGRVHSLSGRDPLFTGGGGGGAHDAFSAFEVLFHKGDQKAALIDAGDNWLTIGNESFNRVRQRNFMQNRARDAADIFTMDASQLRFMINGINKPDDDDEPATVELSAKVEAVIAEVAKAKLSHSDRGKMVGLIAKRSGLRKADLFKDLDEAEGITKVRADRHDSHLTAAREVIATLGGFEDVLSAAGSFWCWTGKVWQQIVDEEVRQAIHRVSGGSELTAGIVDSIFKLARTQAFRKEVQFDLQTDSIPVANGEIRLVRNSSDDITIRLEEHRRESYRRQLIDIEYDPSARAPRFVQFLSEVFSADEDAEQKVAVVQEMLGLCLTSETKFEKFFMLIGNGSNGKTILMKILALLVGEHNMNSIHPSKLGDHTFRVGLDGKLLNLVTEVGDSSVLPDDAIKAIVSGEPSSVRDLYKSAYVMRPVCKLVFGTNSLPPTRDFSDGLFRRAIILTFNNSFVDANPVGNRQRLKDLNLIKTLTAELPGILNFALEGLERLHVQERFTDTPSCKKVISKWRNDADQVALFFAENCRAKAGGKVEQQTIYDRYKTWTHEAGIKNTLSRRKFNDRLELLGYERWRSNSKRYLRGFELRSVFDIGEE